jgi:hypothetical protein
MRQLEFWKDGPRFANVFNHLKSIGPQGCTRDDLDRDGICPIQSACGVVLQCIRAGVFEYTGERRLTRLGQPARVFRIAERKNRKRGKR